MVKGTSVVDGECPGAPVPCVIIKNVSLNPKMRTSEKAHATMMSTTSGENTKVSKEWHPATINKDKIRRVVLVCVVAESVCDDILCTKGDVSSRDVVARNQPMIHCMKDDILRNIALCVIVTAPMLRV